MSEEKAKTKKVSNADLIWSKIKSLPIDMFSLPNQTVQNHVSPVGIPGNDLMVRVKSPAVVPALETAIGDSYSVNVSDEGIVIVSEVSVGASNIVDDGEFVTFVNTKGEEEKISKDKLFR